VKHNGPKQNTFYIGSKKQQGGENIDSQSMLLEQKQSLQRSQAKPQKMGRLHQQISLQLQDSHQIQPPCNQKFCNMFSILKQFCKNLKYLHIEYVLDSIMNLKKKTILMLKHSQKSYKIEPYQHKQSE
jgi:hypothetical protein